MQSAASGTDGAHDLDHLSLRRTERAAELPRSHVLLHTKGRKHPIGLLLQLAPVEQDACQPWQFADENVLGTVRFGTISGS